ncbi:MAG: hypothetical protein AAF430_20090 [Myxococcota bacterium]
MRSAPTWIAVLGTLAVLLPLILGALGKRRAERQLPDAAAALGLERDGPQGARQQGRYKGQIGGRRVIVRPDTFGMIRVGFESRPALSLSTDPAAVAVIEDVAPFETGDAAFDRLFRHRLASAEVAELLRTNERLRQRLVDFSKSHSLRSFAVDAEYVTITGKVYAFFHYIPADRLEPLIADLVALADAIEPELGGAPL